MYDFTECYERWVKAEHSRAEGWNFTPNVSMETFIDLIDSEEDVLYQDGYTREHPPSGPYMSCEFTPEEMEFLWVKVLDEKIAP